MSEEEANALAGQIERDMPHLKAHVYRDVMRNPEPPYNAMWHVELLDVRIVFRSAAQWEERKQWLAYGKAGRTEDDSAPPAV